QKLRKTKLLSGGEEAGGGGGSAGTHKVTSTTLTGAQSALLGVIATIISRTVHQRLPQPTVPYALAPHPNTSSTLLTVLSYAPPIHPLRVFVPKQQVLIMLHLLQDEQHSLRQTP
ncbi:unnamed protein product, partial [Ectocarpus sp. 12 AP-2014]